MLRFALTAPALALLLCACSDRGREREITKTQSASSEERFARPGATSAERFGGDMAPASSAPVATDATDVPGLRWDLPPGWTEVPPTDMRVVNLRVGQDPGAECALTILQGSGGGIAGNVDRWRDQMGLEPLSPGELERLPKRSLLGQEAVLVEIDGTYSGMGDSPRADWRMYGLILALPVGTVFVKMTGPRELLETEREHFFVFCDSLRLEVPGESSSAGTAPPPPPPSAAESSLTWKAPEGWTQDPPRMMRAVSFHLGETGKTECYVAVLGGTAGGLAANLSRWRSQVGLGPITPEEIAELERVTVLGRQAPLLEAYGTYDDQMGREPVTGAGFLGVACELPDSAVFVKMVGPEADVRAAKADFVAFCASLGGM